MKDLINSLTHVVDGCLYDANNDPELLLKRRNSKESCFYFNNLNPTEEIKKKQALTKILASHGENITIEAPFFCDYGTNIYVGDNFFANHNLVILDGARVDIGNNVFIAPNVGIYTAGHPLDPVRRAAGLEYALPVKIGHDVWIGAGVTIVPGVTIGDNVVIGAGSVVNRDIPENVVAAGNPCKVIRPIGNIDEERTDFKRK